MKPWELGASPSLSEYGVRKYLDTFFWIISILSGLYLLVRWEEIALSGGITTRLDIVVASIIIILVLEATRRSVGNFLAVITTAFLLYPFISPLYLNFFLPTTDVLLHCTSHNSSYKCRGISKLWHYKNLRIYTIRHLKWYITISSIYILFSSALPFLTELTIPKECFNTLFIFKWSTFINKSDYRFT